MKARAIKPRNIEKQKETIFDLMNELVWSKGKNSSRSENAWLYKASENSAIKSSFKLGVGLLTGSLLYKYSDLSSSRSSTSTQESLVVEQKTDERFVDSNALFEQIDVKDTASTKLNSTKSEEFLPIVKLSEREYGPMGERYTGIYRQIYNNKRIIEREDLKIIDEVTKGQNLGGI